MTAPLTPSELAVACDALRDVGLERAAANVEAMREVLESVVQLAREGAFGVMFMRQKDVGAEMARGDRPCRRSCDCVICVAERLLAAPPAPVAPEPPRCERCRGDGRLVTFAGPGATNPANAVCDACHGSGLAPGAESEER